MNWEAISAIGQIVGALAVVISLIYLASEVRSSARATRIASERSLTDLLIRFLRQVVENPDLSELYYRGIHDFESLEGAERMRFSALMGQLFRLYEETFYAQSEGHVAARVWRGAEASLSDFSGYREFRLGGGHARIGSVRILRTSLISYSGQRRLRGCLANQRKME